MTENLSGRDGAMEGWFFVGMGRFGEPRQRGGSTHRGPLHTHCAQQEFLGAVLTWGISSRPACAASPPPSCSFFVSSFLMTPSLRRLCWCGCPSTTSMRAQNSDAMHVWFIHVGTTCNIVPLSKSDRLAGRAATWPWAGRNTAAGDIVCTQPPGHSRRQLIQRGWCEQKE